MEFSKPISDWPRHSWRETNQCCFLLTFHSHQTLFTCWWSHNIIRGWSPTMSITSAPWAATIPAPQCQRSGSTPRCSTAPSWPLTVEPRCVCVCVWALWWKQLHSHVRLYCLYVEDFLIVTSEEFIHAALPQHMASDFHNAAIISQVTNTVWASGVCVCEQGLTAYIISPPTPPPPPPSPLILPPPTPQENPTSAGRRGVETTDAQINSHNNAVGYTHAGCL